ncbi:synaptotagmin-8 isoform X8 [Macaca mulatta]
MGHPPDSPSALAPAGTTAIPGLIPDLIAGTPWPRWALIAGALAAGVLVVSCLLCAACCCCRRHRKKPRDKEAVGLGSARGITTTHLVQPDVDSLESSPGGAQQWGRLQLSLEYDFGSQEIRVGLRQAADLRPGGTVDPYARVSVSTQSGHRHETKVHRGTLCPVFDETCCFHIPQAELPGTTLQVQLFNFKRFSGHEPLGELRLPLGTVDLQHVLEHWYPLGPPAATELRPADRGGAGGSRPASRTGRALREGPAHAEPEEVEEEKDSHQKGHGCPLLQRGLHLHGALQSGPGGSPGGRGRAGPSAGPRRPQSFSSNSDTWPVSAQNVDLVLAVWDRGLPLRAEPVGKVHLGARASGQPLQHWADMLAHARRPIAQWHPLQPAREVDRVLALQPRLRLHLPLPHS